MAGHFSPGYSLLTGPATTPPYQESKEKREIRFTVCYKNAHAAAALVLSLPPAFLHPTREQLTDLSSPLFVSLLFLLIRTARTDVCRIFHFYLSNNSDNLLLFFFFKKSSWFRYGRALTGVMIWGGGLYDHAH
jgi:hypothetical protein